ncbi:MAG TPA: hypothetical protein VNV85_04360 [Puia sp.]|nr:hypothetical protein [Puia sp.]
MKHIASILLLIVLLFNFVGYRLFSSYLEDKANDRLEAKLDKNDYDDLQLISLKIPVTQLSYYNNSSQFERIDGQIEVSGVQYKYVKRRIYNDSVELLCIPNQTAMSLRSAKDEFFRLVNDLQQTGQSKKSDSHSSFKNFSVDNYTLNESLIISNNSSAISGQRRFNFSIAIASCYLPTAEQPPEIC